MTQELSHAAQNKMVDKEMGQVENEVNTTERLNKHGHTKKMKGREMSVKQE
jgi:hypothetical protein